MCDFSLVFDRDGNLIGISQLFSDLDVGLELTLFKKASQELSPGLAWLIQKAQQKDGPPLPLATPGTDKNAVDLKQGDTTKHICQKCQAVELQSTFNVAGTWQTTQGAQEFLPPLHTFQGGFMVGSHISQNAKPLFETSSISNAKEQKASPEQLTVRLSEQLVFSVLDSSVSINMIRVTHKSTSEAITVVTFPEYIKDSLLASKKNTTVKVQTKIDFDPGVVIEQGLQVCLWRPKSPINHVTMRHRQEQQDTKSASTQVVKKQDEPELESLRSTQNPKADWQKATVTIADSKKFALPELFAPSYSPIITLFTPESLRFSACA